MTPAPISVERLRELLAAALDRAQRASRPHHNSGATSFDASVEYVTAFAEVRTQHAALLHQLAEMSADLEREQGVREDAQRQLRAAERAREESIQALRAADEWILNAPHGDNCFVSDHCEGDPGNRCNCGRESVLNYIMETRINHDAAFLAASGGAK